MKKIKINVAGMHCHSCEIILEKSIKKIPGISKATANQAKGTIEIHYDGKEPSMKEIEKIVIESGYALGIEKKLPWVNKNIDDYVDILMIGMFIYIIFLVFKGSGFSFGSLGNVSSPTLAVSFLIGLTAGISSCMALVGGLILGISSKWNKDMENSSRWSRFEPHLYFNLGRILGFGLFGGILGIFGSFISLSNVFLGFMTFLVGAVMLLLGINLTNISPRLGNFSITLPKFIGRNLGNDSDSSKTGTMITGALSFFLPCGFTLAMQMYAISTGSFMIGAMSLALFALGTAPGLIGIGGLTAILKGNMAKRFFRFTGVIVLLLGLYNISNGYTLLSLGTGPKIKQTTDTSNLPIQEVRMTQDDSGYNPSVISIKPNTKIKLIVTSTNPYTCASQLMIPSLGITKSLEQGENIIEFISPESGEIKFSCSMGMYTGKFVIEGTSDSGDSTSSEQNTDNGIPKVNADQKQVGCSMMNNKGNQGGSTTSASCGISGGSGGLCGGGNTAKTPTTTVSADNDNTETKTINLTYTSAGLSGNIDVKKGGSYKIIIDVKDTISGCMSTILIPGLDENIQSLNAGNQIIFNINPKEAGRFPITCAMGVPHGYLNVN
ncbi:MAG: sulfite exporter TauE/SafE family protein [Candidatus Gracilibacteria bacterium]|nr:sulfite exporter TauE/SafE family protein [Candidatus Gracilibacteria bacterium]